VVPDPSEPVVEAKDLLHMRGLSSINGRDEDVRAAVLTALIDWRTSMFDGPPSTRRDESEVASRRPLLVMLIMSITRWRSSGYSAGFTRPSRTADVCSSVCIA